MMVTKADVDAMIKKAVSRFSGPYGTDPGNIQVIFSLAGVSHGKVDYMTCVGKAMKHSVTLRQLIGWNLYNGLVDDKIAVLLQSIQQEFPGGYVMAGVENDQVYFHIYGKQGFARVMDVCELLN